MLRTSFVRLLCPEASMYPHPIRRHPDGSLDLDFHRRRAHNLRSRARRELLAAHAEKIAKVAVAVIIVAVSIHLVPARDGTGWNRPTAHTAADYAVASSIVLRR
jgi:hypothetical protein